MDAKGDLHRFGFYHGLGMGAPAPPQGFIYSGRLLGGVSSESPTSRIFMQ